MTILTILKQNINFNFPLPLRGVQKYFLKSFSLRKSNQKPTSITLRSSSFVLKERRRCKRACGLNAFEWKVEVALFPKHSEEIIHTDNHLPKIKAKQVQVAAQQRCNGTILCENCRAVDASMTLCVCCLSLGKS